MGCGITFCFGGVVPQILNQRVRQLEAEGQGLRVLESENQTLRDRIGGLMSEVDKASKDHANETHRLKKEVFNLRMQLEQVHTCTTLTTVCTPVGHA